MWYSKKTKNRKTRNILERFFTVSLKTATTCTIKRMHDQGCTTYEGM